MFFVRILKCFFGFVRSEGRKIAVDLVDLGG